MAGGPDFVEILKHAIQGQDSGFVKPPLTGGTQISIRFREDRLFLFDELSRRSGWNRTQVIDALIEKGLLILFGSLDADVSKKIIESCVEANMKSRQ